MNDNNEAFPSSCKQDTTTTAMATTTTAAAATKLAVILHQAPAPRASPCGNRVENQLGALGMICDRQSAKIRGGGIKVRD